MKPSEHDPLVLVQRFRAYAFVLGLILLTPCLFMLERDPVQFERSYLLAFLFTLAPAGGALLLLALHCLTGGRWGDAIFHILRAAARTLPIFLLLFVPIALGLELIYPWAEPDWLKTEAATAHKVVFYGRGFFFGRSLFYLLAWAWLARITVASPANADGTRSRASGAIALLVYVLTMTFASIDWGMSLGAEWFSTIYGLVVIMGQILSMLTLAVLMRYVLDRAKPQDQVDVGVYHDLGTLIFAFVMTWCYLGFSQFLIIWSANLPEEVSWYVARLALGWKALASVLVVIHFAVPFLLLLMRKVKRKPRHLACVCALLFSARLAEQIWLIVPSFHPETLRIHWMDVLLPLSMLSLWIGLVLGSLHSSLAAGQGSDGSLRTSLAG